MAIARRTGRGVHIFSLEGCQRQGFLARLVGYDLEGTLAAPPPWGRLVLGTRRLVQAALWLCVHPRTVMLALLGLLAIALW